MADQDPSGKGEVEVGADVARRDLTDLMGSAAFLGKRFVLTRNGKRVAALIPMKDLERLRQLDAA